MTSHSKSPTSCGFGILGTGMCVPDRIMTNADMEKIVETNDEWIVTRTGIKERRVVAEGKATSDLATEACRRALDRAGISVDQIDLIICATVTPDTLTPSTACMVQRDLGIAGRCPAFDISAACTGFVYGLSIATSFMRAGVYQHALVIGAECLTRVLDYSDRNTCVLFGDGAGAAVVGPTGPERGLIGQWLGADGSMWDHIMIHDHGTHIRTAEEKAANPSSVQMKGMDVFKFATRIIGPALEGALKDRGANLSIADLDIIFPHQANLRIIESAAKKLDIPMEKVYVNIHRYGNTSAATIPIALAEAESEGRLRRGDLIAMVSFGAGMTCGASIWKW